MESSLFAVLNMKLQAVITVFNVVMKCKSRD